MTLRADVAATLNPEQIAAVNNTQNVFLVACPGSGKTRTLTAKIVDELDRLHEHSEKRWTVALTYTHRAADEIHERVETLGADASRLWIGTLHSFCLEWILQPYSIYHPVLRAGFEIIGAHEAEELLEECCSEYTACRVSAFDCTSYPTTTGRVLTCRSDLRAHVDVVLTRYRDTLRERKRIDFDDLLVFSHELIIQQPPIREFLGRLFSSILIDEFQDTRQIQYAIVGAILRAGRPTIRAFVVGDPNQAIFESLGGRAISHSGMSTLLAGPVTEMTLRRNYRSTSRIVEFFQNFQTYPNIVQASGVLAAEPGHISLDVQTDVSELSTEIGRIVRNSVESGVAPSEICVVAPQWAHLASMTRALAASAPDLSFDGPGVSAIGRDLDNFWYKLARILLTEPSPDVYARRTRWATEVLGQLSEYGALAVDIPARVLLRHCNLIVESIAETDGLAQLRAQFDALCDRLAIDVPASAALEEQRTAFFAAAQTRISRIGAEFGTTAMFKRVFAPRAGVTVSTIHGVKGAEFDVVVAYALLQGMIPHWSAADPVQSARRLLYVICSRARRRLHLIAERGRETTKGNPYSTTRTLVSVGFHYDTVGS